MLASQRGLALVITLLITAVLVTVVTELVYGVYISTSRATNFRDGQRAALLAASAVEMVGNKLDNYPEDEGTNITMEEEGLTFHYGEEDGAIDIRVIDEQGKVSLKIVHNKTGIPVDTNYDAYTRLLNLVDQDEWLLDTLADWIDEDDEPRTSGAEGIDYYRRVLPYYDPKNDDLDSVEELMMVKGYDNRVFSVLKPYVTVYTDGLVNINTAGKTVLMTLSDDMTETLVENIMDYRRETPFKEKTDLKNVPGFAALATDLLGKIDVKSNVYRIYARATVGEAIREVEAVVELGKGNLYWREM